VLFNIVPLKETTKHATHMGGMTKHGSVTKIMGITPKHIWNLKSPLFCNAY
jgi:hypothetical protein